MAGHGHIEAGEGGINKRIALVIAILALFLALSETLGKSAQTKVISYNIEAANLWAFFQARTIRQTQLRTAAEAAALVPAAGTAERIAAWEAQVARWESEPSTGEGRRELSGRARGAEASRDLALARYHHYEVASAAFQIGIVLASAAVITGFVALAWIAGIGGLIGVGFLGIGLFAPHAVHLF